MIDFHSHILPQIDDGSQSVEETYKMIEEAKKAGFSTIIATSHYIEGYFEKNVAQRSVWINAINKSLKDKKENIQLRIGNEMYFSENIIKLLEEEKAITIDESSYLLFEFPINVKPMNIYDVIYSMLQYKLVPILAHPERYSFIQNNPEILNDLINKGVLMQVNYGSFNGMYGEASQIIANKMMKNNMIHFLGSDAHSENSIYIQIPDIIKNLELKYGIEQVDKLTKTNPKLVMENKKIEIDTTTKIELTIKEKIKMKLSK